MSDESAPSESGSGLAPASVSPIESPESSAPNTEVRATEVPTPYGPTLEFAQTTDTPPPVGVILPATPSVVQIGAQPSQIGAQPSEIAPPWLETLRSKPVRAFGWFLLLAALPYIHPRLKFARLVKAPWDKSEEIVEGGSTGIKPEFGELALPGEDSNKPKPAPEPAPPMPEPPKVKVGGGVPPQAVLNEAAIAAGATLRSIEDPTGHAMDAFFKSLDESAKASAAGLSAKAGFKAITRVAHYGDSLITSDYMSATMRRRFQQRFGDSGHGFILTAKPWEWYFHMDVNHWASEGWSVNRIVNPRIADEMYGYGMASFRGTVMGTKTVVGTSKPTPGIDPKTEKEVFGRRATRFDVHYLEQPNGGSFDVLVDGKKIQTFSTKGPTKKNNIATVNVEDGEHSFEMRVVGPGEVRTFGSVIEREVPGVVWDALGINGARARLLDVSDDAHWAEALQMRGPNMVILQYGTNESEDTGFPIAQYEATLEPVLKQVREAMPNSTCLVVGTMDRAGSAGDTRPIIPKLSEAQRKVAHKVGCAFWDTFQAMGGKGAMSRWMRQKPRLGSGDATHPTLEGAQVLGDLLFGALMAGYEGYRLNLPVDPTAPSSSSPPPK